MKSNFQYFYGKFNRDISEFKEELRKEIQKQINSNLTLLYGYPPGKKSKGKSPDLQRLTKLYMTMLDLELL